MLSAQYYGPGDVRVEEIEEPTPGPDEVKIDVVAGGICGSDLHRYGDAPGKVPVSEPHPLTGETMPITLGHEFGGTVVAVGDQVSGVAVGDTVTVNPVLSCGTCRYCNEGRYHHCESVGFVGVSGSTGGFAEYAVVAADQVVPFPAHLPLEWTALVEPLSVAVHAVRRSELQLGDTVAVFGSGPIGMGLIQAARAAGAKSIVVSEPVAARREAADLGGADLVLDPVETDPDEAIDSHTGGGVDVAFDAAGVEPTVTQAIGSTRVDGTVTVVSLFEDAVTIQPNDLVSEERTVLGTSAYLGGPLSATEFGITIEMLDGGAFDPGLLVSSEISIHDIVADGFEALLAADSSEIKVLVRPD